MRSTFGRPIFPLISAFLFAVVVLASPLPASSRPETRDFTEYWTEAKQNATIICSVIGGIIVLCLGIWWYRRHRKRNRERADHQAAKQTTAQMASKIDVLQAEHKKRQQQMKAIFNLE